jgi:hypothetical protein
MPSPMDYPFHSVEPPITIHWELKWRLPVESARVQADGLVERQSPYMRVAWLQLLGIDAAGRPVSFTPPTRVVWRSPSDLESFTIVLKPRGGEQRYEVRLYSFEYEEETTP